MAQTFPAGWRALQTTGIAPRIWQTLAALDAGLDTHHAIFHGVHWARVDGANQALTGQLDFVVIGPQGRVLIIEQRAGLLSETPEGLVCRLPDGERRVPMALAATRDAITERVRKSLRETQISVDALLYCPDYRIRNPGTVGMDPARIVDVARRSELVDIVCEIVSGPASCAEERPRLLRFFGELFELVPDVQALVGETAMLYTRLSGGLAHWARQIDCTPHRVRVLGTAGSGKTQLALSLLRDAVESERRALYVCYNRPLADHVRALAPPKSRVVTYHQLADETSRAAGVPVDFSRADAFTALEGMLDAFMPGPEARYDELIVDEAQDFQPEWAANLQRFLAPGGRVWWMEDPLQNLYGRQTPDFDGWVSLRADTNFRSPREIVDGLLRALPGGEGVRIGSPVTGTGIDIHVVESPDDFVPATIKAVSRCLGAGLRREHIAVLTYRGRESSRFRDLSRLGNWSLHAPTGRYDLFGHAEYTEGELVLDTVHRFKGRAAPCVVLTEIDFEQLDTAAVRRLYVGATRATVKLALVLSARAAHLLNLAATGESR